MILSENGVVAQQSFDKHKRFGWFVGDLIGDLIVGALQAHARKEAAPADARPHVRP